MFIGVIYDDFSTILLMEISKSKLIKKLFQ